MSCQNDHFDLSTNTNWNNIHLYNLSQIFDQFELNELLPLRVICHHWNDTALDMFARCNELTVLVNMPTAVRLVAEDQLCNFQELFYADDIVQAYKELAREHRKPVIEWAGKIVSLTTPDLPSFVTTLKMHSTDRLQRVIVHWRSIGGPCLKIMPYLTDLIQSCPGLTRLSVWLHLDCFQLPQAPLWMRRFCRALCDNENLVQLDVNILKFFSIESNYTTFGFDLTDLFPRLQRFSLGNCHVDLAHHLALAGRQLRHLKWAWDDGTMNFDQFRNLITNPNAEFTTSVTSLALMSFNNAAIDVVSTHFTQLQDLKLVQKRYNNDFDLQLITTLGRLVHLTDLKLINYEFLSTHQKYCSLPSVIKLTLTSSSHLFRHFYTEHDPLSPETNKVNVASFTFALFAQFPAVRELTLAGQVYQAEQVRQRLREALKPRLSQLHMFFVDCPALENPNFPIELIHLD